MNILNSYWRMEYITSPKDNEGGHDNPFENLPRLTDEDAGIVYRSEYSYLVLNRYPYNPGHLLVVPFRKVADLTDLEKEERADLMDLMVYGEALLRKSMNPDAFNMGFNLGEFAGAGIPQHLHGHIVPRWNGDTNFMTVIGKTRTLPQALKDTWKVLVAHKDKIHI